MTPRPLTEQMVATLEWIAEHGTVTHGDVARGLGSQTTSERRRCETLARRGYLYRRPHSWTLDSYTITPNGRTYLAEFAKQVQP